jgi:release factor glutamine methyltransferase
MSTIVETMLESAIQLNDVSDSAQLDVELLLCHALNYTRAQLIAHRDESMPESDFPELLARRLKREPIAYILGEWEFYSLPLAIRPPTLVPRPETEHLVELALELLPKTDVRILEIGTGTGCIPIALVHQHPKLHAISADIKPYNLELARENAVRHNLDNRIEFIQSDLFENVGESTPFDLICSNPPYVPDTDWDTLSDDIRVYEDRDALTSGDDGLDLIRKLIAQAQHYMLPNAPLLIEIGASQAPAVAVLLEEHGFHDINFRKDLAGIDRIAMGRKPA